MTPAFRGILWIALIIALFAGSQKVNAGTTDELREHLDGKVPVHNGVCWFDPQGKFSYTKQKASKRCVVGKDPEDVDKEYLLILDGKEQATELLLYDPKTKVQKSLWKRGTAV